MTNNLSIGLLNTKSLFYDYSGAKVVFDPLVQAKYKAPDIKGWAFRIEKLPNGKHAGVAVVDVEELNRYQYKS